MPGAVDLYYGPMKRMIEFCFFKEEELGGHLCIGREGEDDKKAGLYDFSVFEDITDSQGETFSNMQVRLIELGDPTWKEEENAE